MQLIFATLVCIVVRAVAAAPNPAPSPDPTPAPAAAILKRQSNSTGTLTGEFTGADGGLYGVTSQSGYIQVAGHTLTPGGGDALVGNVDVTAASSGFVVGGETVALISVTSSSVSTTSMAMITSTASESATVESSSSSEAGAGPTGGVPVAGAILGGLAGVLLL